MLGDAYRIGDRKDFVTNSGIKGEEYIELVDDQVFLNLILYRNGDSEGSRGYGAILRIDKDVFYQKEETIRAVLKSFIIYEFG